MKFYFCETCGKRVTEQDVEAGRARNKKLNGVFCAGCAEGVMTMELQPVSEDEARRLLNKRNTPAAGAATARPPTSAAPTLKRDTSQTRIPAARTSGEAKHTQRSAHPAPAPAQGANTGMIVAGAAAALLLVAGLLVAFKSGGEGRAPEPRTAQGSPERAVPPAPPALPATVPAPEVKTPEAEAAPVPDPAPKAAKTDVPAQQAPQEEPPKEPAPAQPDTPAPKVETGEAAPKPDPAAPVAAPAPPVPPKPVFDFKAALEIAASGRPWKGLDEELRARLDEAEPAERARIQALLEQGALAERVPQAAEAYLRAQAGKRVALNMASGVRRLVTFSVEGDTVRADLGDGMKPLDLGAFAPFQVLEFAKAHLGDGEDAQRAHAAWQAFHGDAAALDKALPKLPEAAQALLKQVLEARQAREAGTQSKELAARFLQLKADGKAAEALAAGKALLLKYPGAPAVKELEPDLETQLAELEAQSSDLYNVFLCDAKRLPDGRVSLEYDFAKPQHVADLVNRGLAPRFLEVDGEITLGNDSRWDRIVQVGDAYGTHYRNGRASVNLNGKQTMKELKSYNPNHGYYEGPVGGVHRYRFKAGPQGFSFQVDDDEAIVQAGPWKGGVIRWPGHYVTLPSKLSLTGRLDPRWVAEMAEAAKERTAFLSGAWVNLKPSARAVPLEVAEFWFNSYTHGSDKEKRSVLGWHECGAAWRVEGQEWVSPPADLRPKFHARFWPMALAGPNAELSFEARCDKGFVEIEAPGAFNYMDAISVCIFPDKVAVQKTHTFDGEPGTHNPGSIKTASKSPKPGQWQRYQLIAEKGKLRVLVEGAQALEYDYKAGPGTWAFWSYPGCEYRLRNVKVRKTE
ncbi:MAG: hypothetical protein KIS92_05545 [Planctomycetota bacterium]|nr:hypothetical protein [Planctomycetota bacterium]